MDLEEIKKQLAENGFEQLLHLKDENKETGVVDSFIYYNKIFSSIACFQSNVWNDKSRVTINGGDVLFSAYTEELPKDEWSCPSKAKAHIGEASLSYFDDEKTFNFSKSIRNGIPSIIFNMDHSICINSKPVKKPLVFVRTFDEKYNNLDDEEFSKELCLLFPENYMYLVDEYRFVNSKS